MTCAAAWFARQSFAGRVREERPVCVEPEPSCASCKDRGHVVDRLVDGRWVTVRVGCNVCGHEGGEL